MYFSLQVNLNLIKMYTVAIYSWVVRIDRNSLFFIFDHCGPADDPDQATL
jgi:hypothetical protein